MCRHSYRHKELGEKELKQLKNLQFMADMHFDKHTRNIKLCCMIFFEYVNSKLRSTIPEYQEANIHDRENGILLCPECIVKEIKA